MVHSGILVVDKPKGMTSHDVVMEVKKRYGVKAGHTGTLDPMATGILVLCLGEATRFAYLLQGWDKVYEAEVTFGLSTETDDIEGGVLEEQNVEIDWHQAFQALKKFLGQVKQTPPVYAAVRIEGKRAYERARAGEPVIPKQREVTIYSLAYLSHNIEQGKTKARILVHCSKGTYLRSLARDWGAAMGFPSCLSALRRYRTGIFNMRDVQPWDGEWKIMPVDQVLRGLPRKDLKRQELPRILSGKAMRVDDGKRGIARLYYNDVFLGLGQYQLRKRKKPYLVARRLYSQEFIRSVVRGAIAS